MRPVPSQVHEECTRSSKASSSCVGGSCYQEKSNLIPRDLVFTSPAPRKYPAELTFRTRGHSGFWNEGARMRNRRGPCRNMMLRVFFCVGHDDRDVHFIVFSPHCVHAWCVKRVSVTPDMALVVVLVGPNRLVSSQDGSSRTTSSGNTSCAFTTSLHVTHAGRCGPAIPPQRAPSSKVLKSKVIVVSASARTSNVYTIGRVKVRNKAE